MLLKNARLLNGDFKFVDADLAIEGGRIAGIYAGTRAPAQSDTLDLGGMYLIPGLIDIHMHGCAGFDTCDATYEALNGMSEHLAGQGITSFCPTSMSFDRVTLEKVFSNVRRAMEKGLGGAYVHGINMEGPYINPQRCGAQNPGFIRKPDIDEFRALYSLSGGNVRLVDIAPEAQGAMEFIRSAAEFAAVSLAHTSADYETAATAQANGARHATHLFNAMTGLAHREPGVAGAVLDSNMTAELICDGVHIHPAVIRMAYKLLGPDRLVLVSDSMRAAGLADGVYSFGGQSINVKDGVARTESGAIAGSTTNLLACVKNAVKFGIPLEHAVKAATINPAFVIGASGVTGSIEGEKYADLLVLDGELNVRHVFVKGKKIL